MSDGRQGWSEPTPDELSAAIRAYDHVAGGGRPRDPIENGLRIARKVAKANGMAEDPEARPRTIAALARIVQVDRDVPKARVNSLMAARMVMTDLSLQRDAAIAHDLDALDARDWWSNQDVTTRRPEWTAVPALSKRMTEIGLSPSSVEALARAEFHLLPAEDSAKLRTSMEGVRMGVYSYRVDLDIDIMSAAGLLPKDKAAEMRSRVGFMEDRLEMTSALRQVTRTAIRKDRVGYPEPYGTERERDFQTSAINLRQRTNDDMGRPHPFPVTQEHRVKARRALLDADFSSPETPEGRAVKASTSVLRDLGVPDTLLRGEGFERTIAHAVSRTTYRPTGEVKPELAASDIVASTIIRHLAVEIVRDADSKYRGASEETIDRGRLNEAFRMANKYTRTVITQSPRDLPDVRLLAEGRADEIGDANGLRSHLTNSITDLSHKGPVSQMVAKGLSEIRDLGSIEPAPAPTRFSGLSGLMKGPKETGADWISMMAVKAKGREAF